MYLNELCRMQEERSIFNEIPSKKSNSLDKRPVSTPSRVIEKIHVEDPPS